MARSRYKSLATRGFVKAWRTLGEPMLSIVPPIADWALPVGVAYNPRRDEFNDGAGARVNVLWSDQDTLDVAFLPGRGGNAVGLEIPGVRTTETTDVTVLWTADVQTAVAAAYGIAIDGRLFHIRNWALRPLGVETPFEISISLVEGE